MSAHQGELAEVQTGSELQPMTRSPRIARAERMTSAQSVMMRDIPKKPPPGGVCQDPVSARAESVVVVQTSMDVERVARSILSFLSLHTPWSGLEVHRFAGRQRGCRGLLPWQFGDHRFRSEQ